MICRYTTLQENQEKTYIVNISYLFVGPGIQSQISHPTFRGGYFVYFIIIIFFPVEGDVVELVSAKPLTII